MVEKSMRILFVQLPTSHLGAGEVVYPLGLSRLAAQVPNYHIKSAIDMNLTIDPWTVLKERLEGFSPDVVALSFRNIDPLAGIQSSYLSSLRTSARLIRHLVPETKIIIGGPAFSLFARELMEMVPEIDMGLIGEGEAIIEQLLTQHAHPTSIPNLIWRDGKKLIVNPPGSSLDIDCIPQPSYDCFCPSVYLKKNKYVAAMGIEGKRGCDLHCGYCVYPRLGGTRMRLRNPKIIVDEMEHLHKEYGVSLFHFTDSVVNRPLDHFEVLCRELIRRDLKIGWTGFMREDGFTAATAALAKKSGLVACYFSADALTDHGLKLLNKRLTTNDILKAAKISADHNILTMCHFLVNLPFETERHRQESIEMMEQILAIHHLPSNLGAVIFNTVRLYPGAPLTRMLIKANLLDPRTNLLYPVYYNPVESSYILHELEALCYKAGIFSRLRLEDFT